MKRPTRRHGLAIPLAAGFCVIMTILIGATVIVRKNVTRQQKADWQGLKAHFVAQAAIQGALYKFRVMPNEAFEASQAFKLGVEEPLNVFLDDVGTHRASDDASTETLPLQLPAEFDGERKAWIVEGRTLNSVEDITDDTKVWQHVIRFKAQGGIEDGYVVGNTTGGTATVETRMEEISKTVEIKKVR